MNIELFKHNRNEFMTRMEDRSFAVFFSGEAPHKTGDQFYSYTADRNFFYLTGLEKPNYALVLLKSRNHFMEFLFIEEATDYTEKWLGHRYSKEEASAICGIDVKSIYYLSSFESFVTTAILSDSRKNIGGVPNNLYLDLYRYKANTKPDCMSKVDFILSNYPELCVINANVILDRQRMYKAPEEVEEIEKAIAFAKVGIEAQWKAARPGMNERELDALFDYSTRTAGSDGVSFNTIIASGANATTLHYDENKDVIAKDSLVLTDLGCLSGPYASDITRTFPISGKFTPRQKELYEMVLDVNKKCIEFVKPGIMMGDLNAYAKKLLAEGAVRLHVIDNESEIDRVYYHGVSHYLGLDVHDVGTYSVPVEAGIVCTIEPGIYINEEKIGIRIEDDVLVTETGCINLSKDILKEVKDIEKFMQR